jgi:UDP-N-acetyl-D-glucosamine dehydrogenase
MTKADDLLQIIKDRRAKVGVIGLGYVGLPLSMAIARAGFTTFGFEKDIRKITSLRAGNSHIHSVSNAELNSFVSNKLFSVTDDLSNLEICDVICICVPTPLTPQREPDLNFVVEAARAIAVTLKSGQLIILESTSFPGTTDEIVRPIFDETGLNSSIDYFLGYSPERQDPGNTQFNTFSIPKIVAGDGESALAATTAFYELVVESVIPVSSIRVAEVVKITENVFRSVNIGLVNELKIIFEDMAIDIWEVIEAAKTKPFGFMPFYPGPGIGGHCIPVDPFYLTWKSREFQRPTRFIELAWEINQNMPRHIVQRLEAALSSRLEISLSKASILIIGLAYKKNVADVRESPALSIVKLLCNNVEKLAFHDPFIDDELETVEFCATYKMARIELNIRTLSEYDVVLVITDHDKIDYELIAKHSKLIIDTRNAFATRGIIVKDLIKA